VFHVTGVQTCALPILLAGSVLLPAYRGRQLGHRFFDERETHARSLGGFEATVFPVVERSPDDPRRPPFGRSHESFWQRRGYVREIGRASCRAIEVSCA